MLSGTYQLPKVKTESMCRITKDYWMTEVGLYQIHSMILMTYIPFEESKKWKEPIEKDSVFINDEETMPFFEEQLELQNYLTTRYVGRAPLEWAEPDLKTKMGRRFILVCLEGIPLERYRYFGTESAVHNTNRNANEIVQYTGGGE